MAKTYIKEFEDWLMMGSWPVETACQILAGIFPASLDYDEGTALRIADGKKFTDQEWVKYKRIRVLWEVELHDWAGKGKDGLQTFPEISSLDSMGDRVRPCYAINWSKKKRIELPWLNEARENGFPVDKPKARGEKPNKTEPGTRKVDNLKRLLSIWAQMMIDPKYISIFRNQTTLIEYTSKAFENSEPAQSGLSKGSLDKLFGEIKKVRDIPEIEQIDD